MSSTSVMTAPADSNALAAFTATSRTSFSSAWPTPRSSINPTRNLRGDLSSAFQLMLAGGRPMPSRRSGRDNTLIIKAASSTVRLIGPATRPTYGGSTGTRPRLGFSATRPHQPAGSRTEPPLSVPRCSGPYPAAPAAPAPALEPPGFLLRSQGLRVRGWKLDRPDDSMP